MIAIFIRHADYLQRAETPSALQPYGLSEQGKAQARTGAVQLKAMLERNDWQIYPRLHSSRMLRAWQTAQIMSQALNLNVDIDCFDALAERSMGALANLTIHEIEQVIEQDPRVSDVPLDWKRNSHYQLPFQGAESLFMAGERVARHVEDQMQKLYEREHRQNIAQLFFGHGASFRHAVHVLGMMSLEQASSVSMYHAMPVAFSVNEGQFSHVDGLWKQRDAQVTGGLD